jgi:hypothetical protein
MLLIPLACVEVAAHELFLDPTDIPVGALRDLGGQCEVALEELPTELADEALAIWVRTRSLFQAREQGSEPSGRWVRTTRVSFEAHQQDGGKRLHGPNLPKLDLTSQYHALEQLGPAGVTCQKFLSAEPNATEIESFGAMYKAQVSEHADGSRGLQLSFLAPPWWPTALGSGATLSEVGRTLTMTGRYAPWRDRPLRRLRSASVAITELWAVE